MYTPRGGSSLSPSSRLRNGTTISIWIRFRYVVMMKRFTNLEKAILKGYASKTLKICCYSWSIFIQRRVEDLQLGVKSYQKRLNLTKPDTYRPDLKRRKAYTAYSNPSGFIYQNKDKKKRLMRIDELHKFSDETLNDVRNALDDRLKGIWMQYLTTIIWRRGDKDRAAAMIQAIEKMLKTRRIMRSLEKFVGGRLSTTGSQSRQLSASESAFTEEPVQTSIRWRNPHIRCLKQMPKINPLFKPLSILNGFPNQGDHHHRIVTGTKLYQPLKEMLSHG
nr:hypothetical protein [Tanacetum cinerariifolium]